MSFKFDASKMLRGLAEKEIKTKAALGLYADTVSKNMESSAKANYKWTPRSGAAHQRLNGSWKWIGNVVRVELSHGVDYGVYLELANEGKYAILWPTVQSCSPKAIRGLNNLLK